MNSNTSSSSVDSDEEIDMQIQVILELAQEAVTLIHASTTSLSRTRRGRRNIPRDRVEANERLMRDYFGEDPTYSPDVFRRRFRMSRELFKQIVEDLVDNYPYFAQRNESRAKQSFTSIQMCTSAV